MNTILFGMIGMWETVAILAVVLILFGAKKVPELARGLGEGIKEFKKASREVNSEMQRALEEEPVSQAPPKASVTPAASATVPRSDAAVPAPEKKD